MNNRVGGKKERQKPSSYSPPPQAQFDSFIPDFSTYFPMLSGSRGWGWGLQSVHNTLPLLLSLPHAVPLLQCGVPPTQHSPS